MSDSMTPLERAARALFDMDSGVRAIDGKTTNWLQADDLTREKYNKEARAVLQAIREPSEAMIDEGYDSYNADNGSLRDVFMNMIGAALEEG